jgi:arylformamidase
MVRHDISMPLFPGMPVFPGTPGFEAEATHSLGRGDPYSLSRLVMSSHEGTHVDPPSHFESDGATIDRIDLDALQGPCEVVDIPASVTRIGAAEVELVPPGTSRVLFRTSNSARWASALRFFPDYVAVSLEGAVALRERGLRLVGIDSLSLESDPTETFPAHHALLGHGVLILEGLLLQEVAPGPYVLDCLPLRWRGGDGGPARAVLHTP